MTRSQVEERLRRLEMALTAKRKGSLTLRPYTGANSVDAVQLLYVGMTMLELTNRELGIPVYLHYSFSEVILPLSRSFTTNILSFYDSTSCFLSWEYFGQHGPGDVRLLRRQAPWYRLYQWIFIRISRAPALCVSIIAVAFGRIIDIRCSANR